MIAGGRQFSGTDTRTLQRLARQNVAWRDLTHFTTLQTIREMLIPVALAAAALAFAHLGETVHWGFFGLSLAACFMFFLAGLRLSHDAFHNNLGLTWRGEDFVLVVTSAAMMINNHVVKHGHLNHHRHCMSDKDFEAASAHMTWWQALLFGPDFPVRLHIEAWQHGTATIRRFMILELGLCLALIVLAFTTFDWFALKFFVVAMLIGECLTAFLAVWTVHHDTADEPEIARTQRGIWHNGLTLNMFHHAEHHLISGVPTRNLPRLAERIDHVVPQLTRRRVLPELQSELRPD